MPKSTSKPILCVDFDGVLHSYKSGWQGIDQIPDPPVPGALQFLRDALEHFEVHIFSSRSSKLAGKDAMFYWLSLHASYEFADLSWLQQLKFPSEKPPAFVTIDDRAITFTGTFPDPHQLLEFKPWNKR